MGPILQEFKQKRAELIAGLYSRFARAMGGIGRKLHSVPPTMRITVQGGVGTSEEDEFLRTHYEVDGTGWGTPFLLVPEVTNVDADHVKKLAEAGKEDIRLGGTSPVGVPFWCLRTSSSETERLRRIKEGKPGSPCPKGFLGFDTQFGDRPLCVASRAYQKKKLEYIANNGFLPEHVAILKERVIRKACICVDLAGGAVLKNSIQPVSQSAVCSGPGIEDFSKIVSLKEMVDHIYGRLSLITNSNRPHMFIRELSLYVDYLREEITDAAFGLLDRSPKYFLEFNKNLCAGIDYCRTLAEQFDSTKREGFLTELDRLRLELGRIFNVVAVAPSM